MRKAMAWNGGEPRVAVATADVEEMLDLLDALEGQDGEREDVQRLRSRLTWVLQWT